MVKKLLIWALLLSAAQLLSKDLNIYYTSNRQGELDPCGCQVEQIGGINRMAEYLSQSSKKEDFRLVVDSGDTFFSAKNLNPILEEKESLRAETIAKAYSQMGVEYFTPGERDFAKGLSNLKELIEKANLKVVSSNLYDLKGGAIFSEYQLIKLEGGLKIGITGVISADLIQEENLKVKNEEEALLSTLNKIENEGASLILILSHLGLEKDREMAKKIHSKVPKLFLGAHSQDPLLKGEVIENSAIYQPMHEGQQIGKIIWNIDENKFVRHEIVSLNTDLDKNNSTKKLMDAFKMELKKRELKKEINTPTLKEKYVGNPFLCRKCHVNQYQFWEKTHHASSYLSLFSKNQHLDSECIGCHSLGFGERGGFQYPKEALQTQPKEKAFIDTLLTEVFSIEGKKVKALDSRIEKERYEKIKKIYHEKLGKIEDKVVRNYAAVQCEHCHESRVGHPGILIEKKKINVKRCQNCHTKEKSPSFNEAWINLVACPSVNSR